ncbi:MAG TPA: 50S ribosomal protein L6 [Acidimicrobiales bacterium]|jgi:large subunit ribosomal protein L6|nr:50S ribosomal protein L6 [Acidimicrobiales bacterium]
MSRIGRSPIPVPSGVEVSVTGRSITVRGPRGSLSREIPEPITVRQEEATLLVERPDDARASRSRHGLVRSLVANMVTGVTTGYTKELEIVGVGFRASAAGKEKLDLALGFSHPVSVEAPEGISFSVPVPTRVIVEGNDKQRVGQVAADIRALRKPEPYKGKGVRYLGERVIRKSGKAAK